MHSEHGADFPVEPLEGVYSMGSQHTNIYLENEMPPASELSFYKNSLLIVMKDSQPVVHYVNQNGHAELISLQGDIQQFTDTLKKEMQHGEPDFYTVKRDAVTHATDLLTIIDKNKKSDASKNAFVLCGSFLYYVNGLKREVIQLNKKAFNKDEMSAIKQVMGVPPERDEQTTVLSQHKTLNQQGDFLIGMADREKRNVIRPVNERTPIDMFFSKQSCQVAQSFLSPYMVRGENQYFLYEAEVNPAVYPPNKGDLIVKKFETIKEMDEKSFDEKKAEVIDEVVKKAEQTKRDALKAVKNPFTYIKILTKLSEMLTPHAAIDLDMVNKKIQDKMITVMEHKHDKQVVEPRSSRAYEISETITMRDMSGSRLEWELNTGGNPFNVMKVWIVSDIDPAVVANRRGISDGLGRSFVCATEIDARELAEKIKENYPECQQYLASEPLVVTGKSDQQAVLALYHSVLTPALSSFKELAGKHQDYVREYNQIGEYNDSAPIKVEMDKKENISIKEYSHFQQIANIHEKLLVVYAVIGKNINQIEKVDSVELSKQLKELHDMLKQYVELHPYKNKSTDPVFSVFSKLNELKNNLPQVVPVAPADEIKADEQTRNGVRP
jgi:hypothetical protein